MKKSVLLIILSALLLFSSCTAFNQNPSFDTKQIVLVYMVGSDLETEAGLASKDIAEMMSSGFNQENMTVLLCAGGADYWWTDELRNEDCAVYNIGSNSLTKIYEMQNKNMANPQTLTEFIDFAYENTSASNFNIIFWNHGGGAVLGFGADETYDYDALSLQELNTALSQTILFKDGKKFDLLCFDACLMSSLEVASTMSPYAYYMVASEEIQSGDGLNYSFLKDLSEQSQPDEQNAISYIINSYSNHYEKNYIYTPDYAIAGLNLSKVDDVISKLNDLADVAFLDIKNGQYSKIARVRSRTKSFGKIDATGFYDTVDLYDLTIEIAKYYPYPAHNLLASLNEMVVSLDTNIPCANGVSIYFPYENKEYLDEWLNMYYQNNFSESYTSFVKAFSEILSGKPLLQWETTLNAPIKDETSEHIYYLQLTYDEFTNFDYAKYSVWQEESPNSYICWINSSDVDVSENGRISSAFSGKRFFISDTGENSLPCCVFEIDRNDDYTKYAVPIFIMPSTSETITLVPAYVHFKIANNSKNCEIIGIYRTMETDKNLFPIRDTVHIQDGDKIFPFYFASEIAFLDDGTVAPFEDWTSTSGIGNNFIVEGEINISYKEPAEKSTYLCIFDISDTQGNRYFTKPIYIEY